MFSKKRKQQDLATQKGLGIAVHPPPLQPQAQRRPSQPLQPPPTYHERTASSESGKPLVSPLQMTFDFELPPSPALSAQSPYKSSLDSDLRPQTSDGTLNKKSAMSLAPPILPPIRRVASKESSIAASEGGSELEGSTPPLPSNSSIREARRQNSLPPGLPPPPPIPPPEPPSFARFDSDNVSTSSSKSRRKSRIKSFFGFEPPPDLSSISRPSSSSGAPPMPPMQASMFGDSSTRPATSGGDTFKMESSLFPAKAPPPRPPPALPDASTPAMTRAWIDARDKPYAAAASPRPPPVQSAQSSPSLSTNARSPSTKTNFSKRSPLTPLGQSDQSPKGSFTPSPGAGESLHRPPSHAPTNYSGSTARSIMSPRSATATDTTPIVTLGTPYQENSPSFPQPQYVATRPKTAGAASTTIKGVSIPTHHTSSRPQVERSATTSEEAPPKPSAKSEKRKTRLLNPMALLSRRKSAQNDETTSAEKAAQEAALQRQSYVTATGAVNRLPDDYDPSIRGRGVHDFSAPRTARRGYSYNEADSISTIKQEWGSDMTDKRRQAAAIEGDSHPRPPKLTFANQGFLSSPIASPTTSTRQTHRPGRSPNNNSSTDSGSHLSSRRTTGFFQEHLGESSEPGNAANSGGRIQAERLENKDFLQRASYLSQQSGVSSVESAVLPPFARRSQVVTSPDDGKGYGQRDSGISDSSISGVSPVTMGGADLRGSLPMSPVSPRSEGSRHASMQPSPSSDRSSTTSDKQRRDRIKSSSIGSSLSDSWCAGARPFSSESVAPVPLPRKKSETSPPRGGPPISMTIPDSAPAPTHAPPEVPPRGASAASAFGGASPLSTINSPMDIPSDAPTPEPMVADSIRLSQMPGPPPRLVEKRASAVGHARRSMGKGFSGDGKPKHHVSNASRFSFQMGSAEEERALEEKARTIRQTMDFGGSSYPADPGSDDEFDEDAIDDLDEFEMGGLGDDDEDEMPPINTRPISTAPSTMSGLSPPDQQQNRKSVSQFLYRPATTPALPPRREKRTSTTLEMQINGEDSGESEEEEEPYWMHEDFLGYEESPTGERRPSGTAAAAAAATTQAAAQNAANDGTAANGSAYESEMQRAMSATSASSGFGLDTIDMRTAANANADRAATSPAAASPQMAAVRDSAGSGSATSDRNGFLSGLNFTTTTLDGSGRLKHHTPAMSSSNTDDTSSSDRRTLSTGLGLCGFSDFKFEDSAPPSRPGSLQANSVRISGASEKDNQNRRTRDSETIPQDVDWTADSLKASPAMRNGSWGGHSFNPSWDRRASSPLVNVSKPGVTRAQDVDDELYFDDGGFEQDVNAGPMRMAVRQQAVQLETGEVVDESKFDDDNFLARNDKKHDSSRSSNSVPVVPVAVPRPSPQQQFHQREASGGYTNTSLGSDGPYPSFAMPNPIKARERDSRLLLEDLPLTDRQAVPVDPSLIPQRNPSEDAKRLGLSSRAPPLPASPGDGRAVQEKLQRYHAALAEAANRAAAEGRFARVPSSKSVTESAYSTEDINGEQQAPTQTASSYESGREEGPTLMNGQAMASTSTYDMLNADSAYDPPKLAFDFGFSESLGLSDAIGGADDSDDYDAFLDSDDVIAAANAEVLASDDDGFYGQEFGFFAKARPNSGEVQAINGGFFGQDGDDGLQRNKSLKEPNLTPITERSEFSTRNSFIGAFGPASAGGWGQQVAARMPLSPLDGEVTSFDQLKQLRARAFGGSQASLQSDSMRNSQSSLLQMRDGESPTLSVRSSGAAPHGYFSNGGLPMAVGYSSDGSSSGGLAQLPEHPHPQFASSNGIHESPRSAASSNGQLPFADAEATPKRGNIGGLDTAPVMAKKATPGGRFSGHSRNSSGADSVAYVQEASPDGMGPPRWVLERRRTSEAGQMELVGREPVTGGWI